MMVGISPHYLITLSLFPTLSLFLKLGGDRQFMLTKERSYHFLLHLNSSQKGRAPPITVLIIFMRRYNYESTTSCLLSFW